MTDTAKTVFWMVLGGGALYVGYYTWLCAKDKGLLVCLIEKTASTGWDLTKDLWNEAAKPALEDIYKEAIKPMGDRIESSFKSAADPKVYKTVIKNLGKKELYTNIGAAFGIGHTKSHVSKEKQAASKLEFKQWMEAKKARREAEKAAKKNKSK